MAVTEATRLTVQRRLDADRSPFERNKLGQFATPTALASDLARYVADHWASRSDKISFLDPALGTGSFFSALRRECPPGLVESTRGVEIDERFVQVARDLFGASGLDVVAGDFTKLSAPADGWRANLVLTNPPYVRHHHLKEEKARLNEAATRILGRPISGLSGLYVYFLFLSHAWMAPGGVGIWLIPSEFMDVNYGRAVKDYLTSKVALRHIHRFDPADVQFDDALVSSAVVVFENRAPTEDDIAIFTYGGSLSNPRTRGKVELRTLNGIRKWTALPEMKASEAPGTKAHDITLSSVLEVKRGIATGDNSFFILPRERARDLGIPDTCLKPILPSPRHLKTDVVHADPGGYPALAEQLALIDTDTDEETLRRIHPRLHEYLQTGEARGVRDAYLVKGRTPWYSQEKRDPPPFVCTYMGRSEGGGNPFRFIRNESRAIGTNSFLLLYPRGVLKQALDADPTLYEKLHAALNSLGGAALKAEGRVYGGGLHKVEPKELGRLDARPLLAALGIPTPSATPSDGKRSH